MQTTTTLLAILFAIAGSGDAIAQKNEVVQDRVQEPQSITIGQSLDSVIGILKQHRIEFHEGGFAFAKGDPDVSHLGFTLDEDHTRVCASFSKSKQEIIGLSLIVFPARTAQAKAYQSWLPATKITLYADRSYAVQFAKPLTREEINEREANRPRSQFPSGR
jgi:hypothetical protein